MQDTLEQILQLAPANPAEENNQNFTYNEVKDKEMIEF